MTMIERMIEDSKACNRRMQAIAGKSSEGWAGAPPAGEYFEARTKAKNERWARVRELAAQGLTAQDLTAQDIADRVGASYNVVTSDLRLMGIKLTDARLVRKGRT